MTGENPLKHPVTVFKWANFLSRTQARCARGKVSRRFLRDNTIEVRHEKTMEAAGKRVGSLSVIVPVYNSEAILPKLLERLEQVLTSLECEHEVVLVNDASSDQSWRVIQELCA